MVPKVEEPISIDWFEIPANLEPGAVLCRVRMSTICGSDLHTISGRRDHSYMKSAVGCAGQGVPHKHIIVQISCVIVTVTTDNGAGVK